MKRLFIISLVVYMATLLAASSSNANGFSFYQKIAVEKDNSLIFEMVDQSKLPRSQQLLLSCNRYSKPTCVDTILETLEEELSSMKTPALMGWKHFLLGRVYFENHDFENSLTSFTKALEFVKEDRMKAAIFHHILINHLILRDIKSSLKTLKTIQTLFPDYNHYDQTFYTYPYSLCEPAWENCTELMSVSRISKAQPLLKEIESYQAKLKTTKAHSDEYIVTSTELGKRYEKICPLNSMFNRVCPDALDIYKAIYKEYGNHEKADYAYLKIQMSKFAYEYEGDEIARSQHIVKYYGDFLKHYPKSPLAGKIRKEYERAIKVLGKAD
ncbi:MAG: hypothetical protein OEV42_08490 [Deltaproteobacteria bacterium]|nr:hypothetical protein [Deltaproteobacteria bacterium]